MSEPDHQVLIMNQQSASTVATGGQPAGRRAGWHTAVSAAGAVGLALACAAALLPTAQSARAGTGPVGSVLPAAASVVATAADITGLKRQLAEVGKRIGVTARHIDDALAGFVLDPEVMRLVTAQPEHSKSTGDYVAMLVGTERIAAGRERLDTLAEVLGRIEAAFGVERAAVVAIWGVETRFGAVTGSRAVIRSLATLALADSRRAAYWRSELAHAIGIVARGDITGDRMLGSWAGAMGHTQFMPSTFSRLAVDFDGDGRRDIWTGPVDALASAANYLKRSGWRSGEPWGFEVVVPKDFDFALAQADVRRPAALWHMLGVRRAQGMPWPDTVSDLRLLLPAGAQGPAFLVGDNFAAVMRYNPSIKYALAVCLLADAIAGRPATVAAWPQGAPLSLANRQELQMRLVERGHATGSVDGIIGKLTRAAIRSYQKDIGSPQDGHPSVELLDRLRADAGGASIRVD